jgi:hypothetical protein
VKITARTIALVLLFSALALASHAQVSTQATATAFNYQGSWYAATTETEAVPLVYWGAADGNSFSLGARELIIPSLFSVYGVVGTYQPDISALIKKTTLNPDQFQLSLDVMGGAAVLPGGSKPSLEGRLNFSYAFTPNTALTGAYAGGGIIGSNKFAEVSAGLEYIFNPQASPSLAMKRLIKRAALVRAAHAAALE